MIPQKIHISAEIGTSHNGKISKAKQLVEAAVKAGADSVKFQWVYAKEILHPNTGIVKLPGGNIRLYDRFKQLEMPPKFYFEMKDFAHSLGCKFICSPFGLKSLQELLDINPDGIKIASPELNHFPMLEKLAFYREKQVQQGKNPIPVILSSGVSTLSDIESALNYFSKDKTGITLLHCITSYPAPPEQYNLRLLSNLQNIFGVPVGVSDHSMDSVLVPVLAAACGASFIEKHITLSRQEDGLDDPVALEPHSFEIMVKSVIQQEKKIKCYGYEKALFNCIEELKEEFSHEIILQTLGSGVKTLAEAEALNYGRTNRSIHVIKDMKAGDVIKQEDVAILRTEKELNPGMSPKYLEKITGAILTQDIPAGQGLTWQHFISLA